MKVNLVWFNFPIAARLGQGSGIGIREWNIEKYVL